MSYLLRRECEFYSAGLLVGYARCPHGMVENCPIWMLELRYRRLLAVDSSFLIS